MSTKTKGFFQQDHGQKQWRRPQHSGPLNSISNNARPAMPPIPATSQAKSKPKAFAFAGDENRRTIHEGAVDGVNYEDNVARKAQVEAAAHAEPVPSQSDTNAYPVANDMLEATKAPHLPHANTFPSTPGMRIPMEELIGSFDESTRKIQLPQESPEERIGWIPNSSSTLLTPNRKRKRARSSSPSCPTTSSQRQVASALFTANAAQAEKKTPDADPAAALWKRYTTNIQQGEGEEDKRPGVGQLVFEGSPRPLETPAKAAGFRRWASTGNDWPTSRTKKRRTATRNSISLWRDAQNTESAGRSKVSALVDKIQESLATQRLASEAKPAVRISAPSSSSPLPEAAEMQPPDRPQAVSPLQAKQQLKSQTVASVGLTDAATSGANAGFTKLDDMDGEGNDSRPLDQDAFRPTKLHLQSKAPLPAYKRPSITRASSHDNPRPGAQLAPAAPISAPSRPPVVIDVDDFGEDFDLSVEDLDEIMDGQPPLHQRQLHQIPAHPDPPPSTTFDPAQNQKPRPSVAVTGQANAPILVNDLDDDDEFACDDLDEASLVQAEFSATQAYRRSPRNRRSPRKTRSPKKSTQTPSRATPQGPVPRPLQRYVVKQMIEGEYTNIKGRKCKEIVVMAEDEAFRRPTAVSLRDSWLSTSLAVGTVIHVARLPGSSRTEESNPPGQVILSDAEDSPLLIVHPDHMLSATTVADSFDCIRKAVLQDRIKATGETSKAMVYGKILHEIFQQALSANRWEGDFLADLVERTVQNHVEDLWELGMADTVLAVEEVKAKMGELAAWAKVFVAAQPSDSSTVDDKKGEKVWMSVSKLIAVEEHIWSPQYGLKGNVDATVQTSLLDHPQEPVRKLVAPFEVKTGKTSQSPAHVAQTALYTLLMSDRYDLGIKAGILYYLESSAMMRVAPRPLEIRQMIQQRNRLAGYIHRARHPARENQQPVAPQTQEIEESGLPDMLRNPAKCGRCYAQASCFSYHALVENGNADSAGMVDDGKKDHSMIWHEAVGHLQLTAKDKTQALVLKEWFTKWDRLLTFEESDISRYRRELWTMSSAEREAVGRCFGNMVLAQDLTTTASASGSTTVDGVEGSGGKINRYKYRFVRSGKSRKSPLNEGTQLTIGEPVVVSSESGQWALANGYVVGSSKRDITVAVDRRLGDARQRMEGFDEERNQSLRGVMTVGYEESADAATDLLMLYRLDKDEFSNGLALIRNNLVTLMSSHPIHTKLRNQLVSGTEPRFATSNAPPPLRESQLTTMNEDQRAAVSKVLAAQDYALILGMPGTGKTTTIAQLIGALLAEGKSILLTSYTHTAVDNILLKIRDIAPPNSILRLGVPAKINAEVQTFCRLGSTPRGSIAEVEEAYMGCQIVAATCMGMNHALFSRRAFDVCIVDEASQITLPTSLGPLLHARTFVLVGDHYQLPPLVQDKAALEGGLDVSLFRQLSEQHRDAVAALGKQYRMCEEIMSLSNVLIYDGQLRCGNEAVATRVLDVKDLDALSRFHSAADAPTCATPSRHNTCWLEELCKPERKVVFANTDAAGTTATETLTGGKNITNQFEATLTAQLVIGLLAIGVPGKEIGVITLYRSQLALLRQLFKTAGITSEVEIDSADRFQGRDKECVILSMVRSNEAGIVGDLLKDWRRVNVALTRARSKLVVVGSRQTLRNNELLDKFCRLVDGRAWTWKLPPDADTCHNFHFSSQALSSLTTPGTVGGTKRDFGRQALQPLSASPSKRLGGGGVLKPSANVGNRSPVKKPGKVVSGRGSQMGPARLKENAPVGIWEEIRAEEAARCLMEESR